MFVQKTNPLRK